MAHAVTQSYRMLIALVYVLVVDVNTEWKGDARGPKYF